MREIAALTVRDPISLLRETDRRGLSPIAYAAFQGALTSDRLLPLLDLLQPTEGEGKIEILVSAVETLLDEVKAMRAEMAADRRDTRMALAEQHSMQVEIARKLAG